MVNWPACLIGSTDRLACAWSPLHPTGIQIPDGMALA